MIEVVVMYKANRSTGKFWKYALVTGLTAGACMLAGLGLNYVSNFDEGQIRKAMATKPPYRSLTNGSMVMHPIETEGEAKNFDMLVAGCADRMSKKKSEVYEMMDNANFEMFGVPLEAGNIKVKDNIPFPYECE
jgi:hypothetical protein